MLAAAGAASGNGSPALSAPAGSPPDAPLDSQPLDDTAETVPDSVTSLAEQVSRRAQLILLRQQSIQSDLQLRLDRMRADFNEAQEMRSEQLREMNALRDMAVEQGKKDDEILKKYITMI